MYWYFNRMCMSVIADNLSRSSHIESTCLKAKKQLELIHWHFHQAPKVAHERLCKLTVLSHLDYFACVWDPHQGKYKEKLISVQAFASKVILQNWTAPRQQRFSVLKWPCLDAWHQAQKLTIRSLMVNLVFHQVLFLNTLTRHCNILIVLVFPRLCHRLIQYLINPPFLYLLFLYGTLYLQLSHLHCQLLLSSALSLLILCINSLCLFMY